MHHGSGPEGSKGLVKVCCACIMLTTNINTINEQHLNKCFINFIWQAAKSLLIVRCVLFGFLKFWLIDIVFNSLNNSQYIMLKIIYCLFAPVLHIFPSSLPGQSGFFASCLFQPSLFHFCPAAKLCWHHL